MKHLLAFLIALCFCIASASAADQPVTAAITLTSPSDYQVFQRQTLAAGRIVVEGRVNIPAKSTAAKPDRLQARVTGNSLSGEWQALPFDARVPRFRGEVSLPVGGWYKLDVRLSVRRSLQRRGVAKARSDVGRQGRPLPDLRSLA
jgi:hypothetical protein